MRMPKTLVTAASAVAILLSSPVIFSDVSTTAQAAGAIDEGKKIAFHRKKGNCLACHAIEGGKLPGNIGPPLVNMKARFPNKADLKEQIGDATIKNPNSIMPPFGKYKILSEEELNKVVDFIYSL